MGHFVHKCVRRINRFFVERRIGLFFIVFWFSVITFFIGFFLDSTNGGNVQDQSQWYEKVYEKVLAFIKSRDIILYLWAVLSTVMGSLIFLQLVDYKLVDSHEDFLDLLIDKIQTPNQELVIVTPNLNLGQTSLPGKFKFYKDVLRKRKYGIVYFYIACSDEGEYGYHSISVNDLGDLPIESSFDHLSYVRNLFVEFLDSPRGNLPTKRSLSDYCFEYNAFVKMLQEQQTFIKVRFMRNPFDSRDLSEGEQVDKNIFLLYDKLYDKKTLQMYKIDDRGLCERIVETDHPRVVGRLLSFHKPHEH